MFIFQPVGSVLSSFLLTYFGRKNCLILINIPFFVIWVLIHLSESIPILMLSSVVLALSKYFIPSISWLSTTLHLHYEVPHNYYVSKINGKIGCPKHEGGFWQMCEQDLRLPAVLRRTSIMFIYNIYVYINVRQHT